jgi:hypothetical protein
MIELKKITELVDEIEKFTYRLDVEGNMSFTSQNLNYDQYSYFIDQSLTRIRNLLLDVIKIVDPKIKRECLQKIYDKLSGFDSVEVDLSDFPVMIVQDHKNDESGGVYDRMEPIEHDHLHKAFNKYAEIKSILEMFFNSTLLFAGMKLDSGKVEGPYDASTLTKLQINTKFNVDQFAYFLFLLKESLIFDARNKSEVAEMASNNFITTQQKHYSKDSIAHKMIPNPSQADKDVVKKELKKMINKIK